MCAQCSPVVKFSTDKVLQSHRRSKHGVRSYVPQYIDDSGICPICRTKFGSRIRVVAHLSDSRRVKCSSRILAGECPPLSVEVVTALNVRDRELKRSALRDGHTHAIAAGAATDAQGRTVGRVQR